MKDSGFVALTIVLVVAGILLALVSTNSIYDGIFFDEAIHKEYRTMNYYYAYDCLDRAFLALSHDYFFAVPTLLSFPEFHCQILSLERQGNLITVKAVGNFMNANVYRSAQVRILDNSLQIVSID